MMRPQAFAIPLAPLLLTLSGLIPFAGAAAVILMSGEQPIQRAQAAIVLLVYGAVILSFLGGVRWGTEMARNAGAAPRFSVLTGSVLGSLVGWAVVLVAVLSPTASTATLCLALAVALVLHWAWDLRSQSALPAWYDGLRTIATLGATAALVAAGFSLRG